MLSNINLIDLSTPLEVALGTDFNFDNQLIKRAIDKTSNETELSHTITSRFGLNVGINCRLEKNNIDILLNKTLIEVKFNKPLTNIYELARALAQAIYYLHDIYVDCKELPEQIFIIDNTTAVSFWVNDFIQYIKSINFSWQLPASTPDNKLVSNLRRYIPDTVKYEIVNYNHPHSFEKFFTDFIKTIRCDSEYIPPVYYDSLCETFQQYIDNKGTNISIEQIEDFLELILYDSNTRIWESDRKKIKQRGGKLLIDYVIEKTLQLAADPHIYKTDMDLAQDLILECKQYIKYNENILVVATIEFLMPLVHYFGNDAPNLYFATPSETKAELVQKKMLKKENVLLYERDFNIEGVLNFMNKKANKEKNKFSFIIGNFPWDDGIDKEFIIKCKNELLTAHGTMAVITSAGWLSGNNGKYMRESLALTGNVKHIWTYPQEVFINPDTQQPIKAVGAGFLYTKGELQQTHTHLTRYLNMEKFETTTTFDVDNGIMLYIGENGKLLWEICTKDQSRFPLIPYAESNNPKIHFSSKLDLNYFGGSKPLGDITGSKLLTGVQLDLHGTNPWKPELKNGSEDDNSAKRFMLEWKRGDGNMARNASYHVAMRIWGILLGMTNTISHIGTRSLGRMSYDILSGIYDSVEEYEAAYYESKNLTAEMIHWIRTVGQHYSCDTTHKTINLKDDTTVISIARSKKRVKETGELFTHRYYIDEILDELEEGGLNDNTKHIIEPSCGDGNFVLAVIERKIKNGMNKKDAISTTWACDLMPDNVALCQRRILDMVGDTDEYKNIVYHNIICADFFNGWDFRTWKKTITNNEIIGNLPPNESTIKPKKPELPLSDSTLLDF